MCTVCTSFKLQMLINGFSIAHYIPSVLSTSINAIVTGNYKGENVFFRAFTFSSLFENKLENVKARKKTFLPDNTCYNSIYNFIQFKRIFILK